MLFFTRIVLFLVNSYVKLAGYKHCFNKALALIIPFFSCNFGASFNTSFRYTKVYSVCSLISLNTSPILISLSFSIVIFASCENPLLGPKAKDNVQKRNTKLFIIVLKNSLWKRTLFLVNLKFINLHLI